MPNGHPDDYRDGIKVASGGNKGAQLLAWACDVWYLAEIAMKHIMRLSHFGSRLRLIS